MDRKPGMTFKISLCPTCGGNKKSSEGLYGCLTCDGLGEVATASADLIRSLGAVGSFSGLAREGYHPTKLKLRVVVIGEKEAESPESMA